MSSRRFKVGDRVKVLPGSGKSIPERQIEIREGEVYTVLDTDDDNFLWLAETTDKYWFGPSRFVLAPSSAEPPKSMPLSAVLAVIEEIQAEYAHSRVVGNMVSADCVRGDLARIHTDIRKLFGHDPDAK